MKKILYQLIVTTIFTWSSIYCYSQVPDTTAVSYKEFKRILSDKTEINEPINWSRIGNKIFKNFVHKFHRDPNDAQWTMYNDLIYARFLLENKKTIAVYNKHGRLLRTVK